MAHNVMYSTSTVESQCIGCILYVIYTDSESVHVNSLKGSTVDA